MRDNDSWLGQWCLGRGRDPLASYGRVNEASEKYATFSRQIVQR